MLQAQQKVASGEWNSDALLAYGALQQKYSVYQKIVNNSLSYRKAHPGAWLVYETGYCKLFGLTGTADVQDALLAGLLCALCFSGLFAMERKGGMDAVLRATPRGRARTVRAKLSQSAAAAAVIAAGSCLPHLCQVLRDYGLPAVLAPAVSIQQFAALPPAVTLLDLLVFWFLCRVAGCWCMAAVALWVGERLGNLPAALFTNAAIFCLPPLLSLSGMKNGIEWLGTYPLFHAAALLAVQATTPGGAPLNYAGVVLTVLALALLGGWAAAQSLGADYEWAGTELRA